MKKTTLKDIAEKAGVSAALVSNYLNRNPSARMSDETRRKIDTALKELDYHGSAIARSLRTGKSRIIGYVSAALRTEVSRQEMMAVFNAAAEREYQIFVAYSPEKEMTLRNIRMLRERGCDAVIVSGFFSEEFSREICSISSNIIILNTHPAAEIPGKILRYDYRAAVREAILYLQSKGHENICYQTAYDSSFEQRYLEFTSFYGKENVWYPENNLPSVEEFAGYIKKHKCTAMLHVNDFYAMRTIQNCTALNIRVPQDLAVIGFDNITAADYTTPTLSSISRPLAEAANIAVNHLIALINGEESELPPSLPCKFIPRGSI